MKQITIPVPPQTVELPLSIGGNSVVIDVPVPASTVPIDESVVIGVLSQISPQKLISYLDTKGYIVDEGPTHDQ